MTVGVVGAGVTGLALSHELAKRGRDSVAFEAADRPGGVVRSDTVEGCVLERGPQRTRLAGSVETLVDELGLRDDLLVADDGLPLYVYADGRLREVPLSARAFLTTDLLSWRGKLRLLGEPLTAAGRESETVAGLVRRKFGHEAYENVVGPLFGGIYGSDPERMPARHAGASLLALERREGSLLRPAVERLLSGESAPAVSFREGMERLPAALYEATADRVCLDTPVTDVRADGRCYVLETADGDHRVEHVVVTTPAAEAARLLADAAPDAADRLDRLRYNPLAVAYLRAEATPRGFGYQVRREEGLRTLGVSWNASLFGRDGVHTCYLGGMDDPSVLDEDDDTVGAVARREFREATGVESEVIDVARLRPGFPAWDHSWRALDGLELPDGIHLATNYTARMGLQGRLREAESLAESLSDGSVEILSR